MNNGKSKTPKLVINLNDLSRKDVALVGGKSSSIGEMLQSVNKLDVRVPGGFSTTAKSYQRFLWENNLNHRIVSILKNTNASNSQVLAAAGEQIRSLIKAGEFSTEFTNAVAAELTKLTDEGVKEVAVRSSATAEDLPDASFAGQQETLLNVPARLPVVLQSIKNVIASLFGDRAIAYREEQGFAHDKVALCVCVQQMVRSDLACAGVMFSSNSESGHTGVI